MTLGIRKLIVLVMAGSIFLVANMLMVAAWLQEKGVIDVARFIRKEYLTGTAITIIVTLLILLVSPRCVGKSWVRRCPVCDKSIIGGMKYCSERGSKV